MPRKTMARLTAAGMAAAVAVLPGVAWAHAEFTRDRAPADSDQTLTLNVPEEKGPAVHNSKVIIEVPGGFAVNACSTPAGWTCESEGSKNRTVVTYTRAGAPAETRFDLAVRTPARAGDYTFQVNQFYDDGSSAHWDGPPDSDNPAPVLRVG